MRLGRLLFLLMLDAAALAALIPRWSELAAELVAPHAWISRVGTDQVAVTLGCAGLWLVAAWLGIGLLATLAGGLPGFAGGFAARISTVVLPAAVRSLVAGTAGAGVLLAPVAALAAPTGGPASPTETTVAVPAPGWPTDQSAGPPAPSGPGPSASSQPSDTVEVRPGDSLWVIAGRRLGAGATDAQIAAAWPRWYAANRATIGSDPCLIYPGQLLQVPLPQVSQESK